MITVELESPRPPATILASLRAHAAEWRESQIPVELRRVGVTAFEGRVEGDTFTLVYERSWYGLGAWGENLRARATVAPIAAGTRIYIIVERYLRDGALPALGGGFLTLIGLLAFGPRALWLLLLPASSLGIPYILGRMATRRMSRTQNPDADYLVRRIEAAVADERTASSSGAAS